LSQASHCFAGAFAHAISPLGRKLLKLGKSAPQAQGVELIDGKNSDAALRASRPANQPLPAATRSFSQR
jgi:hypothetical protein